MANETDQPPSLRKRARLAAAGRLPYEPAAVYAAALTGALLLIATRGASWFEGWRDLLRDATQRPDDLAALGSKAAELGVQTAGALLAASLLCGWGAGWMQRRLSPPAAEPSVVQRSAAAGTTPTSRWFALLLALGAVAATAAVTVAASGLWFSLRLNHLERAMTMAGSALLLFAAADLVLAVLLTRWRHHRFDREQAMSHAEQREEARSDAAPPAATAETRARLERDR